MLTVPTEAEVLAKFVVWGEARPSVRAILLSSSRARPEGPVDLLSDYDLIFAVTDAERFGQEDDWQFDYGQPMTRWGDQDELFGSTTYFRSAVYTDGVKIDYTIWPDVLLERIAAEERLPDELDAGYRVLLDKEGRTAAWTAPTYRAFIPMPPTEAEYRALIEEFWWDTTYVAKALWRGELVFARWVLEHEIKAGVLRRMFEWQIESERGWNFRPGVFGRGLERLLPAEVWERFAATYVGAEIAANWTALQETIALFRNASRAVGDTLGHAYPQETDDRMHAYLDAVRQLPSPEEK